MSKAADSKQAQLQGRDQTTPEATAPATRHPVTPDGRYFVVKGRLWRTADPSLSADRRQWLVTQLMSARRSVRTAKLAGDASACAAAHAAIDAAKRGLGERGPVWWADGAPDLNRHMARNTPYAEWFSKVSSTYN